MSSFADFKTTVTEADVERAFRRGYWHGFYAGATPRDPMYDELFKFWENELRDWAFSRDVSPRQPPPTSKYEDVDL